MSDLFVGYLLPLPKGSSKELKFFLEASKGGVAEAVTELRKVTFNILLDGQGNASFDNGQTWAPLADFAKSITTIFAQIVVTSEEYLVGAALAEVGADLLVGAAAAAAVDLTYEVLFNKDVGILKSIMDEFYGQSPVDMQFVDRDGKHREGVYFKDGTSGGLTITGIPYFINSTHADLDGGTLELWQHVNLLEGDVPAGSFRIQSSDAFARVATLLNISTDAVLAAAAPGLSPNKNHWAQNLDGLGYVYDVTDLNSTYSIPIALPGMPQVVTVNNVYFAAPDGTLSLKIGDGGSLFTALTQLIVPSGDGAGTIQGQITNKNLILGNDAGEVIHAGSRGDTIRGGAGSDTIYGGHGDDLIYTGGGDNLILVGTGADTIMGGGGVDTIAPDDFSYLDSTTIVLAYGETLRISAPTAFRGTVSGFVPGTTIDLVGIGSATTATLDAGSVRVGGGNSSGLRVSIGVAIGSCG